MSTRFFCPNLADHETVSLDGPEAHHLLHVMRLGPGAEVTLFDGERYQAHGIVNRVSRSSVQVKIQTRHAIDEPRSHVTIAMPLPKGDRAKWLIEKLTELGVDRFIPLTTERSVREAKSDPRDKFAPQVIAACKQCGRSRLMQIADPCSWAELFERPTAVSREESIRWLLADPAGPPLTSAHRSQGVPTIVLIGPEGGLTAEEQQQALQTGAIAVSFGAFTLRMETAAIAAAALLTAQTPT